jgi:multicomponent Na+:H+ antiporter subunit E
MTALTLHLLLALAWVFLSGDFSLRGLAIGLLVGFAGIAFSQRVPARERYARAACGVLALAVGFAFELVRSNLQLARDVLRLRLPFHPRLLHLDVERLGPTQTVLLGNLISLTPGTITVDAEEDGSALFVHTLYAADPEAVRARMHWLGDLIQRASGEQPPPPAPPPAEEG